MACLSLTFIPAFCKFRLAENWSILTGLFGFRKTGKGSGDLIAV
jgi:hypothetical protein